MAIVTGVERNFTDPNFENGAPLTSKKVLKRIVAANCLLPACEKLFDLNVFSIESGLSGNAHIETNFDTLSDENKKIILDLHKERPDLCQIKKAYLDETKSTREQGQHYPDVVCICCEYIGLNLDENVVADRLLKIVSALQPQDVYCLDQLTYCPDNFQRYSLKAINENLERECWGVSINNKFVTKYFPGSLTLEEAIEKYCTGENPQLVYDQETQSFFISQEILDKSIEFRKTLNKASEEKNQ